MCSSAVIMGGATNDKPLKTISAPPPGPPFISYPHGISIHNGIDRVMITSTVKPSDLGDAGETVTVLEASTGKVLSTHKVSKKPSPSKAAPVEVMFSHAADPPVAHITVMWATGGSAAWENMTSTGAAFEGEGFFETLWVDNTFPVLASRTVTVSPASPKSDGFTVLVIMTRSMPLWMLMPCG